VRGNQNLVISLHRASDLIMKVDALLTASPKGESRKDVKFLKDKHRCSTANAKDFLYFVLIELMYIFEKQYIHCPRPSCCFSDCKP